jgi:serine protease Do
MRKYLFKTLIFWLFLVQFSNAIATHLPDFTELVEAAGPAVVNISTTGKASLAEHIAPGIEMPELPEGAGPLEDWIKRFFGEGQGFGEEFDTSSLGSGFIFTADGYVVTNYHVVKAADEIVVRLSDRREFKAKLIGFDPKSDIALLKIDAKGLPTLKMGDSSKLKVGEWVLAIGSPFGFDYSATAGIVSAKGRSLPNENYVPFIQTDVAINPGNSGGPLFNLDGEVVGINAQIYSQTGGFMGVSFAIPINVVLDIVDQLKTSGHVTRGWLGVYIQEVTRQLAESFGMDQPRGALVAQVMEDSPAGKAGIKVGDIILRFSGQQIVRSADLPPMVGRTQIGQKAKVEVLRGGKPMTLLVTIGQLPDEEKPVQAKTEAQDKKLGQLYGMTLSELSAEQAAEMAIDHGVLVQSVEAGAARDAGIRAGDVIVMIQQKQVKSSKEVIDAIKAIPAGNSIAILVQRKSGPVFLALKKPKTR